jgi:glycogen synthase
VKVLVVSNAAWPVVGGIEVLLDRLLPALRHRGFEITLLTSAHVTEQDEISERKGITVHRTQLIVALARRDPGLLSRERQRVKRLLAELQPDLIHAHDPGPNLWAIVKGGPRAPILTTMHIGVQSTGAGSVVSIAELLRASAWVTGVSATSVAEVLAVEPSLAGRTSVIENGISPLPLERGQVVPGRVLCIGRLVEQKNFDLVLRALAQVVSERPLAHLVIAGDGPERSALEALAADLEVLSRVTFLGAVTHGDVAGLIAGAQVVALPSRFEGQPLVALEAGAGGRPLISTAVDGLASVVIDGVTGLIVPPDDVAALAAGLGRLVGDPDLCDRLGAAARSRVSDEFGFDRCVDAYVELYRRLVPGAD